MTQEVLEGTDAVRWKHSFKAPGIPNLEASHNSWI